jgi:PQ loop repeat
MGNTFSHRIAQTATMDAITVLPALAAGFAIPQFVPQILKLHRTNDAAGLSTPWALLTGINNAAWFGYFAASRYWFALIPATSAALLGGWLGLMLNRRHTMTRRGWMMIGAWTSVLGVAASVDQRLLGATLTGAFLIQVIPAVTTAYRTRHPTGIAPGTWRLILAEVSCWATFGTAKRDGPLIILGTTGVISALLMLNRARTTANQPADIRHTEHRLPTTAEP